MSTTVDQRVVQMQFDNQHFESNVKTTMSTLDKLKQSLNLSGASAGLKNVSAASNNLGVDFNQLEATATRAGFSMHDVWVKVASTFETQIADRIVNSGKKMVSALTIDPVKTGFNEYETQMNAVQTILANTEAKGSTLPDVNKALDELNAYADQTIYNFTEMTRNIGTFTAAGVDLDTSVSAIKGIANLAAVSGSTSQQASTAMYQLSQALSTGTVRLMDWNSVVNAGMGGEVFQTALKRTSELLGTGAEAAIAAKGSFRESLSEGWLTSEVLTKTLEQFTMASKEGSDEWNKFKKTLMDDGYTEAQAEEILKMANRATDAATKVKTITQLWDVMKESAQSGWAQTWKIIIGDFEKARDLLSPLAEFFTGIINKISDARNTFLKNLLQFTEPWAAITDKLSNVKKVVESVGDVTDKLKYFQDVVTDVWRGDYNNHGDNPDRYDLLKAAGYDSRVVQSLVDLGYQHELTIEDVEAAHKKFGLTLDTTTESTEKVVASVNDLSEEYLKNAGLTADEIKLYKELEAEAKATDTTVEELAKRMSERNGRTLLIESLQNAGSGLLGIFTALAKAWQDIFPAPSVARVYTIIEAINKFSEKLRLTEKNSEGLVVLNENGEKLMRTFKGILAVVDIVATIIGGPLKIAFKIITQLLGAFDLNILDVTASFGDALVGLRDWIDGLLDFGAIFDKLVAPIKKGIAAVKEWIASLKDSENLPQDIAIGIVKGIKAIGGFIKSAFASLGNTIFGFLTDVPGNAAKGMASGIKGVLSTIIGVIVELGKMATNALNEFLVERGFKPIPFDMIAGFVKGLKDSAGNALGAIADFALSIIDKVKSVFGIHSPSTVFIAIGGFIIAGLIAGLSQAFPGVKDFFAGMGENISGFIGSIDWGGIFAAAISSGMVYASANISKALVNFSEPFGAVGDFVDEAGDTLKVFQKTLKSFSTAIKAKALKDIAVALAILVGSIVVLALVIQNMGAKELWNAIGMIAVLGVMLIGLSVALEKLGSSSLAIDKSGVNIKGLKQSLINIALAVLLLSVSVRMIGSLNPDQAKQGFLGLAGLIVAIIVVLKTMSNVSASSAANIKSFGKMLTSLAIALLLLIYAVTLIAKLDGNEIQKGVIGILAFIVFIKLVVSSTKKAGKDIDKVGGMMIKLVIALGLMVYVVKSISKLSWGEMGKGAIGMAAFAVFVAAMVKIVKSAGNDLPKIGGMLVSISFAMLLMVGIVKLISMMSVGDLLKGVAGIGAFALIIAGLIHAVKQGGNEIGKISGAILACSVAIGILAGVAVLLGFVNPKTMLKGVVAVGLLAVIMSGLIQATKNASGAYKNLIAMSVAIAVMSLCVVALSFLKPEKLAIATAAMTALVGVFALLVYASKYAKKVKIGPLIVMTAAVAVLAGVIFLLSKLDSDKALSSTVALSTLMISLASMMLILSKTKTSVKDSLKSIGLLAAMVVPLAVFVAALAIMPDISGAARNIPALTIIMGSMTAILVVLSNIKAKATDSLKGIGLLTAMVAPLMVFVAALAFMPDISGAAANMPVLLTLMTSMTLILAALSIIGKLAGGGALMGVLALTAMAVPLMAFVAILAFMPDISAAAANMPMLLTTLTAMTLLLIPLTLIGLGGPAALIGVGSLLALIVAIGGIAIAIGALVTEFPKLQEFINVGIPIMEQLAHGLGSIIGNLVAGFSEALMATLPTLGLCLSQFMINATPFIQGMKMVDETVLAGAGCLAGAILALTVADLINGIASFIQGGSSFAQLGSDLSAFMINALPFIAGATMLNADMVNGVKALAETVLILTAANLIDGLTSWLTGGSSLEDFAGQLPILGTYLAQFASNLGTFDESTVLTVTCAANALKSLAQAADTIPNSGGWLGKIMGENDIGTFGAQLPQLGTHLANFAANLGTWGEDQVATVQCAADAIKSLSDVAKNLPNDGGWLGKIVGENNLGDFGAQLPQLGTDLKGFADNLGTWDDTKVATVQSAASAIKALSDVASGLPNDGGWLGKIVGDNNLGDFGNQLPGLGEDLKGFADSLGTWGKDQLATVTTGVSTIAAFGALSGLDLSSLNSNLSGFGDAIVVIGSDLKTFYTSMSGVSRNTITDALDKLRAITNAIANLDGVNADSVQNFSKSLKSLAETGVRSFANSFTNDGASTTVKDAMTKLAMNASVGLKDNIDRVKTAATDMATKAASAMKSDELYDKFKGAGSYLGGGFVAGIKSKIDAAAKQAAALANAAEKAAKEALDINSPSRVFKKIGMGIPEGFILGIENLGSYVRRSSSTMARTAVDTARDSISGMTDIINSDIDSQPTIRPVVDLSNVTNGARAINGMFNMTPSIGVLSNLRTINSMMSDRQNGASNDDVVSAINKLRKDLANVGGNSYNINGISYNDDTAVAEAIKILIGATIREGRA